jgi:Flp pilus assembly protein TadG
MAVEIVLLTPVLLMFIYLIVAGGRYVAVQGEVEATARDAARAASFERSLGAAQSAAASITRSSLDGDLACSGLSYAGTSFVAGGQVSVTLQCRVDWDDLGLIGLPGSVAVDGTSIAPLDQYRRTE